MTPPDEKILLRTVASSPCHSNEFWIKILYDYFYISHSYAMTSLYSKPLIRLDPWISERSSVMVYQLQYHTFHNSLQSQPAVTYSKKTVKLQHLIQRCQSSQG